MTKYEKHRYQWPIATPYCGVQIFSYSCQEEMFEQLAARCGWWPTGHWPTAPDYSLTYCIAWSAVAAGALAHQAALQHQPLPTNTQLTGLALLFLQYSLTSPLSSLSSGLDCVFSMARLWAKPCYPLIQSHPNGHSFLRQHFELAWRKLNTNILLFGHRSEKGPGY